jgi:uncharacterized protein YecE (DUF72 family)
MAISTKLWLERKTLPGIFSITAKTTKDAALLGRRHDSKLKTRARVKTKCDRAMRYCVEIRHASFLVPDFFELLREFNIAFVFADTAGKWPYAEDLTADFVYCRLHGDTQLYTSGYSDRALVCWTTRLKLWRKRQQPKNAKLVTAKRKSQSHDLFVYFDNDAKLHAPFDAQTLVRKMK